MNAKRWFAWVCLALMLVADIMLFRSNHQRDEALAKLQETQQKLHDAQAELDSVKSSTASSQGTEIGNLHKQNDVLLAKVANLQQNLERITAERDRANAERDRWAAEGQQASQQLSKARNALQYQQNQMQAQQARVTANACINNLRQIDAAKNQWALEKNKSANDVPVAQDLQPYLKDGVLPVCPDGGTYTLGNMNELPTCTVPGHALPQ